MEPTKAPRLLRREAGRFIAPAGQGCSWYQPRQCQITAGASEGVFTAGDEHAASNIMTTTNMAPAVVFRGLRNERNASMLESYRLLRGARKDFDKSRVSRPGKCCACG